VRRVPCARHETRVALRAPSGVRDMAPLRCLQAPTSKRLGLRRARRRILQLPFEPRALSARALSRARLNIQLWYAYFNCIYARVGLVPTGRRGAV
jgi:hypothetical protein